jgi:hypothetical protein
MNKDYKFRFRILPKVGTLAPYFVYSDQREFSFFRNSVKIDGYGLFRIDDRLQRFTGLLDKDNQEIYENDIVEVCDDKGYYGSNIAEILYYCGCFLIFPPNHHEDTMSFYMSVGGYERIILTNRKAEKIKVIGNVTEHKLFEGK